MLVALFNYERQKTTSLFFTNCKNTNAHFCPCVLDVLVQIIITSPLKSFYVYVETNPYIALETKKYMTYLYCRALKKHNIIKRICIRYIRKRKRAFNTHDLLLNPLSIYKSHEVVDIMDQHKKYTFRILDLSNMMFTALIHSDEFYFAQPIDIKNPYTNMKLSNENLYIIYYCMQYRGIPIHPLFSLYMQEDFNLSKFSIKFEGILKDYIVDHAIKNFNVEHTLVELNIMIHDITIYNYKTKRDEHIFKNEISNAILITLKPLLYHYFHYLYSMNSFYRNIEYIQLLKKLISFKLENPRLSESIITVPLQNVNYKNVNIPQRQVNVYSLLNIYGI